MNERYSKSVLRDAMETIEYYYPEQILEIYSGDAIVKTFRGRSHQIEIGDFIKFYDDGMTGQDMQRRKGALVFSVPFSSVCEFERVQPTEDERDFFKRLLALNSRFLENRSYGSAKYDKEKAVLKSEAKQSGIAVEWERFKMPHE